MKTASFAYYAPKSVDEALELLAKWGPQNGRVLAGGQSLVPTMAFRLATPEHLIDINGIPELGKLSIEDGVLSIGACVRHSDFETNELPGPTGALLRKVVRNIAHYPIRTRGTFCGSIANADPASEWCCVVAALDGTMVLRSERGIRRAQPDEFFQGIMTTGLEEDELVAAVELPILPEGTRTGFDEFSRRKGDFAIAMAVASYRVENGRMVDPRIAIGGAEPRARRVSEAEQLLSGQEPGLDAFVEAAIAAAGAIDPMEDINNAPSYRRSLVRTLVQRALEKAT